MHAVGSAGHVVSSLVVSRASARAGRAPVETGEI